MDSVKFSLTLMLTVICCLVGGCSSSLTGKKATPKKPVDELYLARVKDAPQPAGYMDKSGQVVIDLRNGLEVNGKKYTAGSDTERLRLLPFVEGLAGFCVKSKDDSDEQCGFLDKTGRVAIAPDFKNNNLRPFSEGLAAVELAKSSGNWAWGYVDRAGKVVIDYQYESAGDFHDGLAAVQKKDGKLGFIDATGKTVIEPKYRNVSDFSGGYALATEEANDKITLIVLDKTGKETARVAEVKEPVWVDNSRAGEYNTMLSGTRDRLPPFQEGLARVQKSEREYQFIGPDGVSKFEVKFPLIERLSDFSEGYALVKSSFADKERLKEIVGADRVQDLFECSFVDEKGVGKSVPFSDARSFSEGLAGVFFVKDGLQGWGYINTKFEPAVTPVFEEISSFEGGLAWVKVKPGTLGYEGLKDSNWFGYIDQSGKPVVPRW